MPAKGFRAPPRTREQTIDYIKSSTCRQRITSCWLFMGNYYGNGYGRMHVNGRERLVHRVSYEVFIGPIPDGLVVDHLCSNRGCVNPDHLEAVPQRENAMRSIWRLSNTNRKECCSAGHKYTEGLYKYTTSGSRLCLICKRAKEKVYYDLHRDKLLPKRAVRARERYANRAGRPIKNGNNRKYR